MFRFDNHTFDPETGELDGPRESLRLPPKPARLLTMLLEAGGELVERDDIRAALPYVTAFVLLAAAAGLVLWQALAGPEEPVAAAPARLAVVPFIDPASDAHAAFNRDLTEAFVTALVAAGGDDVVVVGPSTTAPHFTPAGSLATVARAVDGDFVLHGGYRSESNVFFVELVLPDGAHLYARRMDLQLSAPAEAPPDVVAEIIAAMREAMRSR